MKIEVLCSAVCLVLSQMTYAQNDRTFPNVSATFVENWPCQDATNGPWTMSHYYAYSAEPAIQFQGLDWGEFGNNAGYIAVSGQQVLFWHTLEGISKISIA